MPISILIKRSLSMPLDDAILLISRKLLSELNGNLLLVESFDGADGSNVRIVVKEKTDATIDKILQVIAEVEDELGVVGLIFPDIVTPDELKMQGISHYELSREVLIKLKQKLVEELNDKILFVEDFDGADGSNVRIVVKEKTDATIDKILQVIAEVEDELGVVGLIFPDIVTPDELWDLS